MINTSWIPSLNEIKSHCSLIQLSSGGQWGFNYPLLSQLTWYNAIPSTEFKFKPHTFLIKQWMNFCLSLVSTVLLVRMEMIHIVCLICTLAVYLSSEIECGSRNVGVFSVDMLPFGRHRGDLCAHSIPLLQSDVRCFEIYARFAIN